MLSLIRAIVALFILALPGPALAEWREARSPHFVVLSNGSERELVRATQRLEAVHWMLGLVSGVRPDGNVQPVRIYLVDSIRDVHRAMGVLNTNNSAAGFYRPDIAGAIAVVPRSEGEFSTTILYHEYAHHYMLQYMDTPYPPWMVEGFAEFISTASFEREGQITIGRVANHRSGELDGLSWVPLETMFAPRSSTDRDAGVASYGQYWLTAHYLIMNDTRRPQLNRFLTMLTRGATQDAAYASFDGGVAVLNREVRSYLNRRSFLMRLAPLPPGVMAAPAVRTLRPGEAAIIAHELSATRSLDDEERAQLNNDMAALVARFPDDPAVALLQTRIFFDQERWAEAVTAADRALSLDPPSVRARTWKGWAQLHLHDAGGEAATGIDAGAARRLIIAANRDAPDDPLPLLAYFHSHALMGEAVPVVAIEGLYRASVLRPQDDGLRMTAALALLGRRELPRSRRLLAPLAFSPHPSRRQIYALQLIDWIDRGGNGSMPDYGSVSTPPVEPAAAD